jgi:hypothetical protein
MSPVIKVGGHLAQARVMTHDKPSDPWDKSDVMLLLHASKKKELSKELEVFEKTEPRCKIARLAK